MGRPAHEAVVRVTDEAAENLRLAEWVALLPKRAAKILVNLPMGVRFAVVSQLELMVKTWEGEGVVLDPVSYDTVVTSLTDTLAGMVMLVQMLQEENSGSPAR